MTCKILFYSSDLLISCARYYGRRHYAICLMCLTKRVFYMCAYMYIDVHIKLHHKETNWKCRQ